MNNKSKLPPINSKNSQKFRNKTKQIELSTNKMNQSQEIKSTINEEGGISIHDEQSDEKMVNKPLLKKANQATTS